MRFFERFLLLWRLGVGIASPNVRGARLAMVGVVLGVALLSMSLALVRGFEEGLREHLLKLSPHMEVVPNFGLIANAESLMERLRAEPTVVSATPFFGFSGGLQTADGLLPLQLRAVADSSLEQDFAPYLLDSLEDGLAPNTVLLGASLAAEAGIGVGDKVRLLVASPVREQEARVSQRAFRVAGLFDTGTQLDRSVGVIGFDTGARLAKAKADEVGGIDIRVSDPLRTEELTGRLSVRFFATPYQVSTWQERHGVLFATIDLSRRMLTILLLAIVAIAAFNVVGSLLIALDERRYELIRMLIMGATPSLLVWAMLMRSLYLGLVGAILGLFIGITLATLLNPTIQFMEYCCAIDVMNVEVYFLDSLPVAVSWRDLMLVLLSAVLVCVCAGVYPARRSARLRPAHAINRRIPG